MENDTEKDLPKHDGSKALIEKYNINDQAHSDSSAADFVKTVSEFHHADESQTDTQTENNQPE
jgi:hypothetical protein